MLSGRKEQKTEVKASGQMFYISKLFCAVLATIVALEPTVLAFQKNYPALGCPKNIWTTSGSTAEVKRNSIRLKNKRSDRNEKNSETETAKYTKVEDGSPLGVAIVVLGGSLVVFGGDGLAQIPVWVVFLTASVAAGISRLVRSLEKK